MRIYQIWALSQNVRLPRGNSRGPTQGISKFLCDDGAGAQELVGKDDAHRGIAENRGTLNAPFDLARLRRASAGQARKE